MEMNNTRLKELLDKYLEGNATEQELLDVDSWYRSFENHNGLTEQLSASQRTALEQLLFLRISREISAATTPAKVVKAPFRRWWAAAGVLLLLGAGGYFVLNNRSVNKPAAPTVAVMEAGRSGIKKLSLPDGTNLWLNFDSKARYVISNDGKQREVWLEGEGYFEVAPQQGNAFLVHAGKLDVQVLGTSFNIDAYSPAQTVVVTVATGKVAVGAENVTGATLTANKQAVYEATANSISTASVTAADANAWIKGQLVFKKATFRAIAQRLERRYNTNIRFSGNNVAEAVLTARFDENVPVADALGMLCDIYGFSYRYNQAKNEYLVTGKK